MSQFTEKSKPIPKNRTLKQPRCPIGEYRNPVTGICEPRAPIKTGKKDVLGCSITYEPKDDVERARAVELDTMNLQTLRDIFSDLHGEPRGKKYIAGTKLKQDLINLIVCTESKSRERAGNIEPESSASADTSMSEPVPVPSPMPEIAPLPVPLPVPEIAEEVKENESIYDEVAEPTVPSDLQLPSADLKMQSDMGVAPADMDTQKQISSMAISHPVPIQILLF
jgi:hypothetical protein